MRIAKYRQIMTHLSNAFSGRHACICTTEAYRCINTIRGVVAEATAAQIECPRVTEEEREDAHGQIDRILNWLEFDAVKWANTRTDSHSEFAKQQRKRMQQAETARALHVPSFWSDWTRQMILHIQVEGWSDDEIAERVTAICNSWGHTTKADRILYVLQNVIKCPQTLADAEERVEQWAIGEATMAYFEIKS